MSLSNFSITHEDDQRMIITGTLYSGVEKGAGPPDKRFYAEPGTDAFYNDPAVRVNEQDVEDWNYLRGVPLRFEHDNHSAQVQDFGKFIDSRVDKDRNLFVVAEVYKKEPEQRWLADKIRNRDVGDLSIGYDVVPYRGTNKIKAKRVQEGSAVWRGYFPCTSIGVACSKAGKYKSSGGETGSVSLCDSSNPQDTSQQLVDVVFKIMASQNTAPAGGASAAQPGQSASGNGAAAASAPASQSAAGNNSAAPQVSAPSPPSLSTNTKRHHSLAQPRDPRGKFSKRDLNSQIQSHQQQQQHGQQQAPGSNTSNNSTIQHALQHPAGQSASPASQMQHDFEKQSISAANQLELETRLQNEAAEKERIQAELKAARDKADAIRADYDRLKKAEEDKKRAEAEARVQKMEEALANIKAGLGDEDLAKSFTLMQKQVAIEANEAQPEAIKASQVMQRIGGKMSEYKNAVSEKDKALAEKEARIAELTQALEQANKGHSVVASRLQQTRNNLNSAKYTAAKKGGVTTLAKDKGEEDDDINTAASHGIQASRHGHGGDIGDILLPVPAVQHGTWEARFVQNQYNPGFGEAENTYGVHASASRPSNYNEYEGRLYRPVSDHRHAHYTGHGMKDQGPEGRAWFTHIVSFTDQLDSLPTSQQYGLQLGAREVMKEYSHNF